MSRRPSHGTDHPDRIVAEVVTAVLGLCALMLAGVAALDYEAGGNNLRADVLAVTALLLVGVPLAIVNWLRHADESTPMRAESSDRDRGGSRRDQYWHSDA